MKRKSLIVIFCSILLPQFSMAQTMPAGNNVMALQLCSLNDNNTVQDVISFFNDAENSGSPGISMAHIREPIARWGVFEANFDYMMAYYFPNYSAYGEWLTWVQDNAGQEYSRIATCVGSYVSTNYGVNPDASPYVEADTTYLDVRNCTLREGADRNTAIEWHRQWSQYGNELGTDVARSLQFRTYGVFQNGEGSSMYSVTRVGATPVELMEHVDAFQFGEVRPSLDRITAANPNAACDNGTLWRSTVGFRR